MRIAWRLLLLMVLLGAGVEAVAWSDAPPADDPQVVLEQNRRLLEKWRAEPDHFARLQRDYQAFQTLSPERQTRLRQLDQDLHAEDPATQARLWTVLERYVAWLEKLPEADRAWIEAATDAPTRLERVKMIRDQQWVKRLPRQVQQDLANLPEEKRPEKIADLRRAERQRRLEWFWASHPRDAAALRRARLTRLAEFPPEIRFYFNATLAHLLSDSDRKRLHDVEGNWPLYARSLAKLMETSSPILPGYPEPGRVWPTRFQELPLEWRIALNHYRPEGKAARPAQGKDASMDAKHRREQWRLLSKNSNWPDYAVAATSIVRADKLKVETQLGPNKPDHFLPVTQGVIKNELLPTLSPAEKKDLTAEEGKWPEYPKRLLELAKRHEISLPGLARPCPPEFWDAMSKLLPDVPDRALRQFALNDLTPEERGALKLSPDDDASRERLLEKYWARHAGDLERQLRPHNPKRPRIPTRGAVR